MKKLFCFILLAALVSCASKKEASTGSTPKANNTNLISLSDAQLKNAGIETGKPELRNMQAVLKVNGLIDVPPQNMVTVSFPMGGYLKNINLLPGMHVRKGQLMALIEDPAFIQLQEDYLTGKAKLSFLEKEYERQKLLNVSKAASDKVYEQTTSEYQSQKITVKALQQKLLLLGINPGNLNENTISRTVPILSPITGYVAAVHVNIGKYINPTDVLFELVDPDHLHLALTVFEKDLASIRIGQKVKAYQTSDTTKVYEAEVALVSKTLDSNRSGLVHCHFTGATPSLVPGMFVNADIQVTNDAVIAVPEEAVVRSGDKEYIFIQRQGGQFEMTPVTTATAQNGFVALNTMNKSLLNETIIKRNAYAALMKMKNTGEEE